MLIARVSSVDGGDPHARDQGGLSGEVWLLTE